MLCPQPNVFSIFLGDAKALPLKAIYAQGLIPLDLTACTEIDIALPNADGTLSHLTLTDDQVIINSPDVLGSFTAVAAAIGSISSSLNVGELQNFTVIFTISGEQLTVPYVQALSVFQQ